VGDGESRAALYFLRKQFPKLRVSAILTLGGAQNIPMPLIAGAGVKAKIAKLTFGRFRRLRRLSKSFWTFGKDFDSIKNGHLSLHFSLSRVTKLNMTTELSA
jgi:hypothetical protein